MECADRLGRDVGMDWDSFGEEPHVIDVPTSATTSSPACSPWSHPTWAQSACSSRNHGSPSSSATGWGTCAAASAIGATWADQWVQVNGAGVAETDARTAEEWIQFNCYQILDRSGFAPCGGEAG